MAINRPNAQKPNDLGLYVHWPYCRRLCPYCDFNIYRDKGEDHGDLLTAILTDIEGHAARLDTRSPLQSLSFGGGTPSLLTPAQISAVIDTAARVFGFVETPEISLEANPDALGKEVCAGFARAGINRLSIGVQSLKDDELQFLGRDHNARQGRDAVAAAQAANIRVSADFIYDLPTQSLADWQDGLDQALALGAEHYSLYALTIEPGTAFGIQAKKGRLTMPPEDHSAALFELTQERMIAAGFPAYEVSNHAANAAEQARHNLLYWQNQDWVGVGPGAHGRIAIAGQRRAVMTAKRPGDYTKTVASTGWGAVENIGLRADEIAMEGLAMGLRLRAGLDIANLEQETGFVPNAQHLSRLVDEGVVEKAGNILRVRPKGWALIDHLALELMR